ncbi:aminodeoxychorismate lyase [Pseudoneobacillus sp. C159]
MFIYLNGRIIPKEEAFISTFDHGFLYGVGLFETFRIYDGHPFLLDDHLQRLNEGLKELLIEKTFTREEVEEALRLVLEANSYKNAYIRFNVSAGIGEVGLQVEPYLEPNTIIFAKPLPPANRIISEKRAQLLTVTRRNSPEGSRRLKSHHFLNNILAKREVGASSDVEGIFLNSHGYLAEGVVSNLFWVKDGILYTPSVETGILNGVTRQFIIQLAKINGMKVVEGFYQPKNLDWADEFFITNSIQEVVGINCWNNRDYPGANGEFVRLFYNDYRENCLKLYSRNELS